MLILDASRVDRISLKRFAGIVEKELACSDGRSQYGQDSELGWQSLSTTLAHNVRSAADDGANSEVLNKLRTQVGAVERLRPVVKSVEEENVIPAAPVPSEPKPLKKIDATKKITTADPSLDSAAVDTASGERIQHLLQDQKVNS